MSADYASLCISEKGERYYQLKLHLRIPDYDKKYALW